MGSKRINSRRTQQRNLEMYRVEQWLQEGGKGAPQKKTGHANKYRPDYVPNPDYHNTSLLLDFTCCKRLKTNTPRKNCR